VSLQKLSWLKSRATAHPISSRHRAFPLWLHPHKKKIAFLFSAMRHFAEELREKGFQVRYVTLDDPENTQNLKGELARALAEEGPPVDHARLAQISQAIASGDYRIDAAAIADALLGRHIAID
jgi:flagellar biosynthesis anti-sigma factor FlgM